jgi:hypothetical protein
MIAVDDSSLTTMNKYLEMCSPTELPAKREMLEHMMLSKRSKIRNDSISMRLDIDKTQHCPD